ncbi:F-box/WD repeat-containing protein 7 [Diplonema papillatum]|nr:F-box/WD repeat-containing protein 7 [Diplonema papillatum]|eukprot:gene12899-19891_t
MPPKKASTKKAGGKKASPKKAAAAAAAASEGEASPKKASPKRAKKAGAKKAAAKKAAADASPSGSPTASPSASPASSPSPRGKKGSAKKAGGKKARKKKEPAASPAASPAPSVASPPPPANDDDAPDDGAPSPSLDPSATMPAQVLSSHGTTAPPPAAAYAPGSASPFAPPSGSPFAPASGAFAPPNAINPPRSKVAEYLKTRRATMKPPSPADLDTDPRTDLPLITLPKNHEQNFKDLLAPRGDQFLLHVFTEVGKATDAPPHTPDDRFLVVTDQTLLLCEPTSSKVTRSLQVRDIQRIDNSDGNSLAIVGPGGPNEYDMFLHFKGGPEEKSNAIQVLLKIFKRMQDGMDLPVNYVPQSRFDPGNYRLGQPVGYELKVPPQRTKINLAKTLENLDKQEDEMLNFVEEVQNELEQEHVQNLLRKDQQIGNILTQLEEAKAAQREQNEEILRLQSLHKLATGQEEDVVLENMEPKDRRIYELERALIELQMKTSRRLQDDEEAKVAGNFFERDMSQQVVVDPTRPRGGSLHMQGLVEVLQQQVLDRNRDIEDLRVQLEEMDTLRTQIRNKDATISALRNQAGAAGGVALPDYEFPPPSLHAIPHSSFSGGPAAGPYVPQRDTAPYDPYDGISPHTRSPPTRPGDGPFVPEPYVSRIPDSADQIKIHPGNNLKLINVPAEYKQMWSDLEGAVLHMFVLVRKYNRKNAPRDQILVVSDTCLYLSDPRQSTIHRCTRLAEIEEILVSRDGYKIGLKVRRSLHDYDYLLEMSTKDELAQLMHIIAAVQKGLNERAAIVKKLDREILPKELNLTKPRDWARKLRGTMPREKLFQKMKAEDEKARKRHEQLQRELQEQHEQNMGAGSQAPQAAYDDGSRYDSQDQHSVHAMEGLKHDLRAELESKKDAEFVRLKQRIASLEQDNEAKAQELDQVRDTWRRHRCRVTPKSSVAAQHSEGMYWVPTEPIVLECQLEVLKLQFWDNILITSHANGFLNVWDVDSAECIRTLKDHTAKVIAFQYDGVELVSGSFDSTIRRWNITDGTCLNVVAAHRGQVTCLQFDRNVLVSGASDATIQVWQMDLELRNIRTLRGHKSAVQALRFEQDVLVSAEWGWLFVWDLHAGLVTKALRDEQGGITCLDYCDQYLVTGGQAGVLTLWDIATGEYETLEGHTDDICHIQVEGPFAVTSSADCTIRMWDLVNFKSLGIFNNSYPHEPRTFQFIANRFISVEHKTVKIWTK